MILTIRVELKYQRVTMCYASYRCVIFVLHRVVVNSIEGYSCTGLNGLLFEVIVLRKCPRQIMKVILPVLHLALVTRNILGIKHHARRVGGVILVLRFLRGKEEDGITRWILR
jgi:hypothetical protein